MARIKSDFTKDTKDKLCAEVGGRCSKPDCRAPTKGGGGSKGEAAHITAASEGGLRYDDKDEQRHSYENGIWLCANCHTLIDTKSFENLYTVERLKRWKKEAIQKARLELERGYISDDLFFNLSLELDCTIYDAENDIYLIQAVLRNTGDTSFELKSKYVSRIMIDKDIRNIQNRTPQTLILPNESIMVNYTDIRFIRGGWGKDDNPNARVMVTFAYPGHKTLEQTALVGELIERANQHEAIKHKKGMSSFYS